MSLSNSQVQQIHESAKETHSQAEQLHAERAEKIKQIDPLIKKYSPM